MGAPLRLRHGATLEQHSISPVLNGSDDISTLRTACGTFGMICLSVLVFAFLGQIALVLRKLYTRRGAPSATKTVPVNKPHHISHNVRHLGIIMDGNRRYGRCYSTATRQPDAAALREIREELCSATQVTAANRESGQSWLAAQYTRFAEVIQHTSLDGHRAGGEKLLEVVDHCMEAGIRMVTVYAFSTDNWNRPTAEVDALMSLFFFFFSRVRKVALDRHVFVRFITTERYRLPPRVVELMRSVEDETRVVLPRRLVLNICVSYSGQSEVVAACNRLLARRLLQRTDPASIVTEVTKAELDREMLRSITQDEHETNDAQIFGDGVSVEPDLILRTSGEQRISNFLLYECAYSEFVFLEKAWPEVIKEDIWRALSDFARRERRNGR
ncbi:hypothetical protein LSCM1_05814 [Leishmania martiniquensis]|uniref:Alkyl transferase n=1 Tax=Leishmania martiniquensis TaxID=1580590 RepID=A0A836KQM7_9TRYP|nr:hypothetical protein LSCM1_05814 [Leishmania martiniquensis]